MAKKNEKHHEQVIEILKGAPTTFFSARGLQEVMITRFGTHVNHTNAIAFHLRLLHRRGLIEVREARCRKEYRWRAYREHESGE